MLPEPFAFPAVPHARRHGPRGYRDYRDYKPWLRDEFAFRCAYCLQRESFYPDGSASFSVEHLVPVALRPDLTLVYENLFYACVRCNSFKRDEPLPLDPTRDAMADHLKVEKSGRVSFLSPTGRGFVRLLGLNRPTAMAGRRARHLLIEAARANPDDPSIRELLSHTFGYPADLPDLSVLRPPRRQLPPRGHRREPPRPAAERGAGRRVLGGRGCGTMAGQPPV